MLAILFPDFMHRHDARVLQLRRIGGLGLEASDLRWRRQPGIAQHFHCDFPPQAHLPRTEHHPHSAPGDFFEESDLHVHLPAGAIPGAKIFAQVGCLNCHSYLGSGGGYAGAPDLSAEGSKGKGIQFQIDHLICPSCKNAGSPMPPFKALGDQRLRQLAIFLEASKGGK